MPAAGQHSTEARSDGASAALAQQGGNALRPEEESWGRGLSCLTAERKTGRPPIKEVGEEARRTFNPFTPKFKKYIAL